MLCLWVGHVYFCDSKDTFNRQVNLPMAIVHGHIVHLVPLFLGLLYHELDDLEAMKEQVFKSAPLKSFLCTNFP